MHPELEQKHPAAVVTGGCSKHRVYTQTETLWAGDKQYKDLFDAKTEWLHCLCQKKISGSITTEHSACYTQRIKHKKYSLCFLRFSSLVSQEKNKSCAIVLSLIASPNNFWTCWLISGLTDRLRSQRDHIPIRCVKIIETQTGAFAGLPPAPCLPLLWTSGVPISPRARAALWSREQLGQCWNSCSHLQKSSQQKHRCVCHRTRREEGSALQPRDTVRWELTSILLQAQKGRAESQNASATSLSWPWCVWGLLSPQTPSHWWYQCPKDCPVLPRLTSKWKFLPHPPLSVLHQQFNLWAPKAHVHFLSGITIKIREALPGKE